MPDHLEHPLIPVLVEHNQWLLELLGRVDALRDRAPDLLPHVAEVLRADAEVKQHAFYPSARRAHRGGAAFVDRATHQRGLVEHYLAEAERQGPSGTAYLDMAQAAIATASRVLAEEQRELAGILQDHVPTAWLDDLQASVVAGVPHDPLPGE
jgi:hypothetical protein